MVKNGAISVVVPTYQREQILLDTIQYLRKLQPPPEEIIVVDQTRNHEVATEEQLGLWHKNRDIRWIRQEEPSIPKAMNKGLLFARNDIVLFLDDDIIPSNNLVTAHANAHGDQGVGVVAGKVIQPWDANTRFAGKQFSFASDTKQFIHEFMGGNFSVIRSLALRLGGFDENFIHAAYRFERDFSERVREAGYGILFQPSAEIRHLRSSSGGTRAYGDFLKTIKPSHAVGEYYFLLRSKYERYKILKILWHPLRAVRTKHHLKKPWWIPVTLIAEFRAFCLALFLSLRGSRLLDRGTLTQREQ